MTFQEFERRAREMFDSIPTEYRAGVEYLVVSREAHPHPELPEVWTLGECATGELDLGWDGVDVLRSGVHLYHGSFARVAEQDESFDWEGELWETLIHEIRHHRESTAGEDALEDFDYAADENFKRRDGKPFDPLFYRSGEPVDEDAWEVEGDLFVERAVTGAAFEEAEAFPVRVVDAEYLVPRPEALGDVHFVYLDGVDEGPPGEIALVLVRRRGTWESLRGMFSRRAPDVRESTAPARRVDARSGAGERDAE